MERLDTSDPNSPPHLGKVQITHPQSTDDNQMPLERCWSFELIGALLQLSSWQPLQHLVILH